MEVYIIVSLVFFFVVSHTAFALSNSESLSNHYLSYTNTPANSLSANDEYSNEMHIKTISQGRYIGGGAAGTLLGFGIGHAIQGRWKERGWIHTTLQSASLFVFIALRFYETGLIPVINQNIDYKPIMIGIILSFIGSKIWETTDVWILPVSIKIISQQHNFHNSSPLQQYKTKKPYSVALQWRF